MQQRGGREQLVELAQARACAAHRVRPGDGQLHTREQLGNGVFTGTLSGGAVDNFVGVVDAEGNHVAVLQLAALHLFAIYEEAPALAAIFDVILVGLHHHRRASARNPLPGRKSCKWLPVSAPRPMRNGD